jgi:hypothetical protein
VGLYKLPHRYRLNVTNWEHLFPFGEEISSNSSYYNIKSSSSCLSHDYSCYPQKWIWYANTPFHLTVGWLWTMCTRFLVSCIVLRTGLLKKGRDLTKKFLLYFKSLKEEWNVRMIKSFNNSIILSPLMWNRNGTKFWSLFSYDRDLIFTRDPTQQEYYLTLRLLHRKYQLLDMLCLKNFRTNEMSKVRIILFCYTLSSMRFRLTNFTTVFTPSNYSC